MRKLWITGASGLVGRNLLEHPAVRKYEVLAPTSRELDLLDRRAVIEFAKVERPDIVVHTAGVVGGIQANIAEPFRFLSENLLMGEAVVSAARTAALPVLVNLGSSCMYPRHSENPLRESTVLTGELEPTNEGYALAKIITERLCEYAVAEAEDLQFKTLIPCNLYGRYDHFDPSRSHLVAAVIRKIHDAKVSNKSTVTIWGDGTARREFMYAADLADAVFRVFDDPAGVPAIMNIGVGSDHSVTDYYQMVANVVGWNGVFEFDLSRPAGMHQKLVDTSLQTQWGWTPKTTLQQGLERTYDYFLQEVAL